MDGLLQTFGSQSQVKAVLERMARDTTKPLREALCVTEVAAASDLRAAGDGIPGRVRPFNLSRCRHDPTLEQTGNEFKRSLSGRLPRCFNRPRDSDGPAACWRNQAADCFAWPVWRNLLQQFAATIIGSPAASPPRAHRRR